MISKKRAPSADRTIQRVYDDINELIDAVNHPQTGTPSQGEGRPGDLRVVESSDGTVRLQARTSKGWATSGAGVFSTQEDDAQSGLLFSAAPQGFTLSGGRARHTLTLDEDLVASALNAGVGAAQPFIDLAPDAGYYYRGDKNWAALNTTAVVEGSNLYYTDARARAALSPASPLTYDAGTGALGLTVGNVVGTTNQVTVVNGTARAVGGNVTLSLPQDIHTGASPSFSALTVTGTRVQVPGLGVSSTNTGLQVGANGYDMWLASGITTSRNAAIMHNLTVEHDASQAATYKWIQGHGTFGSRSIEFTYGANAAGIRFYADSATTVAGAVATKTLRFIIGNDGNVTVGSTHMNGSNTFYAGQVAIGTTIVLDSSRNLANIGNAAIGGYLDLTGLLYARSNLTLMNKAASGWITFATRNTAGAEAVYDLSNIGTISSGGIAATGTVSSLGGAAGLIFADRNSGNQWQWYASAGVARLYDGTADRLQVSLTTGNLWTAGTISSGAINGNTNLAPSTSPTFAGLTLNGALNAGTNSITAGAINASGNITAAGNAQYASRAYEHYVGSSNAGTPRWAKFATISTATAWEDNHFAWHIRTRGAEGTLRVNIATNSAYSFLIDWTWTQDGSEMATSTPIFALYRSLDSGVVSTWDIYIYQQSWNATYATQMYENRGVFIGTITYYSDTYVDPPVGYTQPDMGTQTYGNHTLNRYTGEYGASYPWATYRYGNYGTKTDIYRVYMTGDWGVTHEVLQHGTDLSDWRVRTNGADRLTVTNAGNVGIGTTDPLGYRLYNNGTFFNNGDATIAGNLTVNGFTVNANSAQNIALDDTITSTIGVVTGLWDLGDNSGSAVIGAGDSVQVTVTGLTSATGTAVVGYKRAGPVAVATADTIATYNITAENTLTLFGKFGWTVSYVIGKK